MLITRKLKIELFLSWESSKTNFIFVFHLMGLVSIIDISLYLVKGKITLEIVYTEVNK